MSSFPKRVDGVTVHQTHDGLLVQSANSTLVTWLNRTAAIVYTMCTGTHDARTISAAIQHQFDLFQSPMNDVERALGELQKSGLITGVDAPEDDAVSLLVVLWAPHDSISRDVLGNLDLIRRQLSAANITYHVLTDAQPNRVLSHNRAASALISYERYSHVLFVDATSAATTAVTEVSLERILRSGHAAVGIPVPHAHIDWSRAAAAQLSDPDELAAISRQYNVAFTGVTQPKPRPSGFAVARMVGSSALVLSRRGLQEFAGTEHVRRYRGLIADTFIEYLEHMWGFFDTIDTVGSLQLADDVSFCERWRAAGNVIWVDTTGAFGTALAASRKLVRAE